MVFVVPQNFSLTVSLAFAAPRALGHSQRNFFEAHSPVAVSLAEAPRPVVVDAAGGQSCVDFLPSLLWPFVPCLVPLERPLSASGHALVVALSH